MAYLTVLKGSRSQNTSRTYHNALNLFLSTLRNKKVDPEQADIELLTEESVIWFISDLKSYSPSTERLYLTAVIVFFEYLTAENETTTNLQRLRLLIHQRARRPGIRLPQFPRDSIDLMIEYAQKLNIGAFGDENARLRALRDRAFIICLADTGLRVHEMCNLRRGDINWNDGQSIIIGKGNRQAVVRFSRRAQSVLRDYLSARSALDGASGKSLPALPLFARHDKGVGKKIKPITTTTGRNIINEHVLLSLGKEFIGKITPHSFRHYFVTKILHASGNLKLAQELARHQSITVTQRYAHLSDNELDQGYWQVFEDDGNK